MKTLHTHRGTCQICGRKHAVANVEDSPTRAIAKHGYTVKGWGYFVGTCAGWGNPPAEIDVSRTRAIILSLVDQAKGLDETAAKYRSGELPCSTYEEWDAMFKKPGTIGRGAYVTLHITSETPRSIVDKAQENAALDSERSARFMRGHVADLRMFVLPRLGKPLYPGESKTAPRVFNKGERVVYSRDTAQDHVGTLIRAGFDHHGTRVLGWHVEISPGMKIYRTITMLRKLNPKQE